MLNWFCTGESPIVSRLFDRSPCLLWYDRRDRSQRAPGNGVAPAKMARERRTVRYEDDIWERLEARSKATGRPVNTIVNDALRQYLMESEDDLEARVAALEARVAAIEARD